MLCQLKLIPSFLIECFFHWPMKECLTEIIFSLIFFYLWLGRLFHSILPSSFIVREIEKTFLILQEVYFESSEIKGIFQAHTGSNKLYITTTQGFCLFAFIVYPIFHCSVLFKKQIIFKSTCLFAGNSEMPKCIYLRFNIFMKIYPIYF